MPAATTHVEFARDVFNDLPNDLQNQIQDLPMYFLGSQGPDLFFFSRAAILPHSLRKYGIRMHREKVAEVIAFFRRYAAGTPRLEDYVKGFLCHYALDVTVHPLIRHAAHQEFLEAGRNENEAHLSIESCLDAWMLKQRGCTIQDYSCYRDLHISKDDQLLLAGMYRSMFLHVFGLDIREQEIVRAEHEAYSLLKALRPNHIFKYRLAQHVETLVRRPHLVSALMLYESSDEPAVLNLRRQPYTVPGAPQASGSSSFPELYRQAQQYAVQLIRERGPIVVTRDYLGNPIQA
jgi:hypothetical protein